MPSAKKTVAKKASPKKAAAAGSPKGIAKKSAASKKKSVAKKVSPAAIEDASHGFLKSGSPAKKCPPACKPRKEKRKPSAFNVFVGKHIKANKSKQGASQSKVEFNKAKFSAAVAAWNAQKK